MLTLDIILNYYDHFIKSVDFKNLPGRDSDEYRTLLFQTANDEVFNEGRYTYATEHMLELFDIPEANELIHNLAAINKLKPEERVRLGFYMDLKDVCYPLFKGREVDWSAWPWQMKSAENSFDNPQLFDMLAKCEWPYLTAAMLYDLKYQMWLDDEFYSSVAQQAVVETFEYPVESHWKRGFKTEDELNEFRSDLNKCADDLWAIENHMHVGRQLGFDHLTQSVYDAIDTFIDNTYHHRQVDCARELAAWIRENWTIGERHPAKEKVDALYEQMVILMAEHDVSSPDPDFAWKILIWDVLGVSMFSKEDEEYDELEDDDLDIWDDEDLD